MKNKLILFLNFLLLLPGILIAQESTAVEPGNTTTTNSAVDPNRFFYFIILGLCIIFIMFLIFALSKATTVLSKSLGNKYQSKTPFDKG